MRRLIESIEIKQLNHHIINNSKKMASVRKFHFVTVLDGQVLHIYQRIVKDIDYSYLVWKRNDEMQARRME